MIGRNSFKFVMPPPQTDTTREAMPEVRVVVAEDAIFNDHIGAHIRAFVLAPPCAGALARGFRARSGRSGSLLTGDSTACSRDGLHKPWYDDAVGPR